jgi:hypothetical protein
MTDNERSISVAELVTKPGSNGEAPTARRQPKGLLPYSWLNHTLKIDFVEADGTAGTASGAYVEQYGFGPVLKSSLGDKFAISWDRLVQVQLKED